MVLLTFLNYKFRYCVGETRGKIKRDEDQFFFSSKYSFVITNLILRFSMVNKHSIQAVLRLVHKQQENTAVAHHQNGCICRLVVVSKERRSLENSLDHYY